MKKLNRFWSACSTISHRERRAEARVARVDEAAEVERRREEARLAPHVGEARLGGGEVAPLVRYLAREVGVLGGAVARQVAHDLHAVRHFI
jgi:hypothetical protein